MTAYVLSNWSKINWSNDFDARLAFLDMPRISRIAVFWHQIKTVVGANPGPWLFVHLWFWGMSFITTQLVNLLSSDEVDEDEDEDGLNGFILFAFTVLAIILSPIIGTIAYLNTGMLWPLVFTTPLVCIIVTIVLSIGLPVTGFSRASQFWEYVPAQRFFNREVSLPAHIRKRYDELQAEGLQEMDLYVLEFANDPFLVAVEKSNRPWWFRRKVVVGAWDTGTNMDRI